MFEHSFPPDWSTLKKLIWLRTVLAGGSAETLTVTGVSPLALVNAVAAQIVSLTQYGKCEQASTPTPSDPVDIVCNNGTLKMVDDELPAAFKRVLGFQCNDNAMWQITGFKLRGSDTVRISFSVTAACNVFGCYRGANATDNYDLYASVTSGSKYFRYGSGTYLSYFSNDNQNRRFDVVFTPNGSHGMPQDSTWSPLTFESDNDLLLGSTTLTGTSAKLKGNLYGDFIVDGRLKLIPCERASDGALGYYDTYTGTFYEPSTGFDGAVSLGYDGSHYSLQRVGTPEVLTLSGKNLLNSQAFTLGKRLTDAGDETSESYGFVSAEIPVTAGATYTYSQKTGSSIILRICEYGANGQLVKLNKYSSAGTQTVTITTQANTVYVKCSADSRFVDTPPQLELGSTATAYQPYSPPQTATVPNLFAVGDYADTAEIIHGLLTHKVGVKVLDGTEDWQKQSGSYRYYINISDASADNAYIPVCTHFKGVSGSTSWSNVKDGEFKHASGVNKFYFQNDACHDSTAFAAFLAAEYAKGTPVIVLYPLATETTESVTPQPLSTVEGTNTVSAESNVDPVTLEVQYMGTDAA